MCKVLGLNEQANTNTKAHNAGQAPPVLARLHHTGATRSMQVGLGVQFHVLMRDSNQHLSWDKIFISFTTVSLMKSNSVVEQTQSPNRLSENIFAMDKNPDIFSLQLNVG